MLDLNVKKINIKRMTIKNTVKSNKKDKDFKTYP